MPLPLLPVASSARRSNLTNEQPKVMTIHTYGPIPRPERLVAQLLHPLEVGVQIARSLSHKAHYDKSVCRAGGPPQSGEMAVVVVPIQLRTLDHGAVRPEPEANAQTMNLHLAEVGRTIAPGAFGVIILDGAGRHQTGGRLVVPANLALLHLPPYSPELNPVENVWQYLRQNLLRNRVFENYEAIVDACCDAWNALMALPERIRSITQRDWAKTVSA
jgi:hypothetical protein